VARKFIVAVDHPSFRASLHAALAVAAGGADVVVAASIAALVEAIEACPDAELLVLDLNLPGAQGFNALAFVRGVRPRLPVVIVSADDDPPTVAAALRFGAQGFLPKSIEPGTVAEAVATVLGGGIFTPVGFVGARAQSAGAGEGEIARRIGALSSTQFLVLVRLCSGLTSEQIAREIGMAPMIVEGQVAGILQALGVATRTEAVLAAGRLAVDRASVKPPPEDLD
jgi:DNA-binding NarL/FixJ family response regulator